MLTRGNENSSLSLSSIQYRPPQCSSVVFLSLHSEIGLRVLWQRLFLFQRCQNHRLTVCKHSYNGDRKVKNKVMRKILRRTNSTIFTHVFSFPHRKINPSTKPHRLSSNLKPSLTYISCIIIMLVVTTLEIQTDGDEQCKSFFSAKHYQLRNGRQHVSLRVFDYRMMARDRKRGICAADKWMAALIGLVA